MSTRTPRQTGRIVELSLETVSLLAVIALALAGLLAAVCAVLAVRLSRLRQAYAAAVEGTDRDSVFEALQRHAGALDQLRDDLGVIHGNTQQIRELLRTTVSRVGIVRYDAFEDMGGALSFSAALLDERADGVVLSAINGRTETRTYAKPVHQGTSEYNLSPEEVAAIDAALEGKKGVASPPAAKSRRGRAAS